MRFSTLASRPLLAAVTVAVALTALHAPGAWAADCRSNIECIPPVTVAQVEGLAGENGWWRSDVTATLLCVDESGCSNSEYSLDGSDWAIWDGLPIPVTGEGLHALEAASEDRHGNAESYPALNMIRIDGTAPTLALLRPTDGDAYAANVQDPLEPALPLTLLVGDTTVEAALADGLSGAQRVEFSIDGVLRAVDDAAPYTWVWAAGDEAAGEHTLALVGVDRAGNTVGLSLVVTTVPTSQAGVEATLARAQGALPEVGL